MSRRTVSGVAAGALLIWGLTVPAPAHAEQAPKAPGAGQAPKAPGAGQDTRTVRKGDATVVGRRANGERPELTVPPGTRRSLSTTATGVGADFDGDGIGDLVASHNVEDGNSSYGMIVLYSSDQAWENGYPRLSFELYQQPHVALATGDVNADGYDDLVVGIGYTWNEYTGFVWVLHGGPNGLMYDGRGVSYLSQDSHPDIPGTLEPNDLFGYSVATGDINRDGYDDLVVGSPGEAIGTLTSAGMIHIFRGSQAGLTTSGVRALSQADASVPGTAEAYDEFGKSVAVGDVTGDGYADVAVGSSGENGYGMISLLRGSATGVSASGATALVGARTSTVTPKWLGWSTLVADLTGDGLCEVIVGAPGSTVNGHTTAGAVSVYRGRSSGLSGTGQAYWHQDSANVPGGAENGDRFGLNLAVGPVVGSARTDLVVGVQNEAVGTATRAGAFVVLPGAATTTGLTGAGSLFIDQNATGVPDVSEAQDQMGSSLQVLSRDGHTFLVVGALEEQFAPETGPGSGILVVFVDDGGQLAPTGETITGPDLSLPFETVLRLGISSVND